MIPSSLYTALFMAINASRGQKTSFAAASRATTTTYDALAAIPATGKVNLSEELDEDQHITKSHLIFSSCGNSSVYLTL